MEEAFKPIIAPRHHHIADVAYDFAGFRDDGGPVIPGAEGGMAFPPRAHLEAGLAIALEQEGEAIKIRVCASPPVSLRESGVGDIMVVQQAQGVQRIGAVHIVRLREKVGGEVECFGKDGKDVLGEGVGLLHELGGFGVEVGAEERGGGPGAVEATVVLELEGFFLVGDPGGGADLRARFPAGVFGLDVRRFGFDFFGEGEESFAVFGGYVSGNIDSERRGLTYESENISLISATEGEAWFTSTKKPGFSAAVTICFAISSRRSAKSCSEIFGICLSSVFVDLAMVFYLFKGPVGGFDRSRRRGESRERFQCGGGRNVEVAADPETWFRSV